MKQLDPQKQSLRELEGRAPQGSDFVVPSHVLDNGALSLSVPKGFELSGEGIGLDVGVPDGVRVAQLSIDGVSTDSGPGVAQSEPIGQVSDLEGSVTATRIDGSQVALNTGDSIFQGDVIETGADGSIGVIFVDDTVFTLENDGQMVMDEMVYDPDTQDGVFNAKVVQGVFSMVSGQIAKTSPDGMALSTPTATIGIRGSTLIIEMDQNGAVKNATLVKDVDGGIGEIVLVTPSGNSVVLNQYGATTSVGADGTVRPVQILTEQQIQQAHAKVLTKVVKAVAKQAEQKAERAADEAAQAEAEAAAAEAEAAAAEAEAAAAEEAAATAGAEAAAAAAEAEAAAAAAEAALAAAEASGDAEAMAAAEAAAAEAEALAVEAKQVAAQAEAEAFAATQAQAAADAAAADANALAAEAEVAAAQAEQAQAFSSLADTAFTAQSQEFEQVQQNAGQDGGGEGNEDPNAENQDPQSGTADTADTVAGDGPPGENLLAGDSLFGENDPLLNDLGLNFFADGPIGFGSAGLSGFDEEFLIDLIESLNDDTQEEEEEVGDNDDDDQTVVVEEESSTSTDDTPFSQWATGATASTEYNPSPDDWSADQAKDEPNTFTYGDIETAWTADDYDDGTPDWLEVTYDTAVYATGLTIYESYNNGFVYQVDLIDANGKYNTIWTGHDTSEKLNYNDTLGYESQFALRFEATSYLVDGIKIYTSNIYNWDEIDAVELLSGTQDIGTSQYETVMSYGGDETIDGGAGTDTIDYNHSSDAITVDLSVQDGTTSQVISSSQGSDILLSFENAAGSIYADDMTGDSNANVLNGRDGNDIINGGAGTDTLIGGAGNDTLTGGLGNDVFVYYSRTLGSDDLETGGFDTTDAYQGDTINFYQELMGQLKIGGALVSSVRDGTALPTALSNGTGTEDSIALVNLSGDYQIHLDFDGDASEDFTIDINDNVFQATVSEANSITSISLVDV
ncbi:hypothetical protein V5T82_12805 [Magnetovibrio sp. PR-2]|uniref:hypothetical protein n=1 Tax=Magnetovibrio sp. PR-2 TaxID=3120356 RepID=UPI002FCE510B